MRGKDKFIFFCYFEIPVIYVYLYFKAVDFLVSDKINIQDNKSTFPIHKK